MIRKISRIFVALTSLGLLGCQHNLEVEYSKEINGITHRIVLRGYVPIFHYVIQNGRLVAVTAIQKVDGILVPTVLRDNITISLNEDFEPLINGYTADLVEEGKFITRKSFMKITDASTYTSLNYTLGAETVEITSLPLELSSPFSAINITISSTQAQVKTIVCLTKSVANFSKDCATPFGQNSLLSKSEHSLTAHSLSTVATDSIPNPELHCLSDDSKFVWLDPTNETNVYRYFDHPYSSVFLKDAVDNRGWLVYSNKNCSGDSQLRKKQIGLLEWLYEVETQYDGKLVMFKSSKWYVDSKPTLPIYFTNTSDESLQARLGSITISAGKHNMWFRCAIVDKIQSFAVFIRTPEGDRRFTRLCYKKGILETDCPVSDSSVWKACEDPDQIPNVYRYSRGKWVGETYITSVLLDSIKKNGKLKGWDFTEVVQLEVTENGEVKNVNCTAESEYNFLGRKCTEKFGRNVQVKMYGPSDITVFAARGNLPIQPPKHLCTRDAVFRYMIADKKILRQTHNNSENYSEEKQDQFLVKFNDTSALGGKLYVEHRGKSLTFSNACHPHTHSDQRWLSNFFWHFRGTYCTNGIQFKFTAHASLAEANGIKQLLHPDRYEDGRIRFHLGSVSDLEVDADTGTLYVENKPLFWCSKRSTMFCVDNKEISIDASPGKITLDQEPTEVRVISRDTSDRVLFSIPALGGDQFTLRYLDEQQLQEPKRKTQFMQTKMGVQNYIEEGGCKSPGKGE